MSSLPLVDYKNKYIALGRLFIKIREDVSSLLTSHVTKQQQQQKTRSLLKITTLMKTNITTDIDPGLLVDKKPALLLPLQFRAPIPSDVLRNRI